MSTVTLIDKLISEQEKRYEEAKAKALDFSEAYASIERAEQLLEEAKKKLQVRS